MLPDSFVGDWTCPDHPWRTLELPRLDVWKQRQDQSLTSWPVLALRWRFAQTVVDHMSPHNASVFTLSFGYVVHKCRGVELAVTRSIAMVRCGLRALGPTPVLLGLLPQPVQPCPRLNQ